MKIEVISARPDLLIRRMTLAPGEASHWHRDACERFSVVVRGTRLAIEYRDSEATETFPVTPGEAGWNAPEPRVHRAVNVGTDVFEEVVTFYRASADVDPQPAE